MPVHIHPTAPLARRALLPGDPGRALALAQLVMSEPKMFNHNRGLWGYTGTAADGEPLTIQSTGMGGPSAAIVLEELCDLGLEVALRVGTCGALHDDLALGDLVIADAALASDGASRALGADGRVTADAGLVAALAAADGAAGARTGAVASSDLFYDRDPERTAGWRQAGALAVEMEAATLLRVGELRAIRVGCLLAVSDVFEADGARRRIDAEALVQAAERLGRVGAAALAGP
ncbi:MAG: Purine nucleoside phosphorylase [uncultured Solirubrobacteraceae bacterium]|uniref:Uridine phosphorylase n=1 Tax=uncultured Solirubrobacteraceae bacterium TaxID=1162706 RepID=A0A6J4TC70_9ACTN|nr:MAG: Purine nucleoside phosphorylase [uncultured Solirubrobacteraceae bacterium]